MDRLERAVLVSCSAWLDGALPDWTSHGALSDSDTAGMRMSHRPCLTSIVGWLFLGLGGCGNGFICPAGSEPVWNSERLTPESPEMRSVACFRPDGSIHGPAAKWWGDELMSVGHYRDGKLHGMTVAWYGSGQRWWIGEYREGKPTGTRIFWNRAGLRTWEEVWDETGDRSTARFWYDNGQAKFVAELEKGDFHGDYEDGYETGGRRSKGPYREGKRHGQWICWDESGEHMLKAIYDRDAVVGRSGAIANEQALYECRDIMCPDEPGEIASGRSRCDSSTG